MQVRKDTLIRQKEIVAAVRNLIVKYGSEHVTLKAIAKEIGVTDAAIYKHFKSKKDILSFLIDDIEATLLGDIDKCYPGEVGSLEALSQIIMEHISAIERRKGVTFQVIAEIISYGDKDLNLRIYDVISKYIDRIKDILANGIKNGVICPDINIEASAKLFFGMTQGLVYLWALNRYKFKLDNEFKSMWEVFLKTVKKS
jgi:AcrR family transcriptional regulator